MMLLLLLALQASQSPGAADIKAYRTCVEASALKFEKAKEPVRDTVEAAIAACEEMRVKARSAQLKRRPESSELTLSDYRAVTFELWDKVTEIEKRKATATLFQIRSQNADN
jgi:hypothetical protein